MLRGRGNAAYVCHNGCCHIRVSVHKTRGVAAEVWINGESGTFASHAKTMVTTHEALNSKIRRRSCLLEARRPSRDVRITETATQMLAARFLALPLSKEPKDEAA